MTNDLLIRECTIEDLRILKTLSETTFIDSFGDDNNEEDLKVYLQDNFSIEKLEKELRNQNSRYYIALFHGEPAGYMKVNFEGAHTEKNYGDSLEVQRIYVLKKFIGQKIGKSLMERAMEIARSQNLYYLWLGVWERNTAAIGFYERMGFKKIGEHVFVIGNDKQLDYIMKLEL